MKHYPILLFVLLLVAACQNEKPESIEVDKTAEVESNLIPSIYIEGDSTWTIEERMEHYGVPGVSLAVIHDGKIAWTKTYGVMDRDTQEPVTGQTLFQAGSISKPVASYGALRMVEQGKIELEEDINTYLTSWKIPDNDFTSEKKVTLKNLVSHSAGMTVHGFLGYSPDLPVPSLVQVLNGEEPANSPAIYVNKVPEESYRYSGGGYTVMQQMVIDQEGKPYPEVMEELVLGPLQMTNSTYEQPLPSEKLTYAATGYLPDGSMTRGKRHTYPEMAAAGLWTTAEDLAKFAVNIQGSIKAENNKVLSHEMTKLMLTPFVEEYTGLGVFLTNRGDEVYFGHGGWDEGFSSELMAHKDKGYGVVVLTNSNHPDFISELIRSVALTYNWDNYVPQYEALPVDSLETQNIVGKYLVRGYDYCQVFEQDGQLRYKDGPEEGDSELVRVSDSTYAVRRFNVLFQFKENEETQQMEVQLLRTHNLQNRGTFPKIAEGTVLPLDLVIDGQKEAGLEAFKAIMQENPQDPMVNEDNLNRMGYRFMGQDKLQEAKDIFEVNMVLYPESYNTYDSYAEACMELGLTEEAIEFYQKSYDLNAENTHALEQIKRMQSK